MAWAMQLDVLQSISLAGNLAVPNDDRAGSTTHLAWVIDGATDLGAPGLVGSQGGAAWLASQAQAAFTTAADAPLAAMCRAVGDRLAAAFAAARTREPEGRWEWPVASFLAVRLDDDALEVGWLGDCAGLLIRGDTVIRLGPVRESHDAETALAASLAEHGLGAPKRSAPILAELRARRNRPESRVLSIDAERMAQLETMRVPCAPGDEVLLMTDGFSAPVDSYGVLDEEGLALLLPSEGLAGLAQRLRAIEQADSDCTRYPRFKTSDDATALWLRIGG